MTNRQTDSCQLVPGSDRQIVRRPCNPRAGRFISAEVQAGKDVSIDLGQVPDWATIAAFGDVPHTTARPIKQGSFP